MKHIWCMMVFFLSLLEQSFALIGGRDKFPVKEFFQISFEEIDTCYLCFTNPNEKKCCSCNLGHLNDNWCIDILWYGGQKDLSSYLRYLEEAYYDYKIYDNDVTCEAILPTLFRGKVEHAFMFSLASKESCLDDSGNMSRNTMSPRFDMNDEWLYVNQYCADKDGAYATRPIDVEVGCSHDVGVVENTLLKNTTDEMESNCYFQVLRKDIRRFLKRNFCPLEKSTCPYRHVHHNLCKAYYAPTRGYKNYHCFLCDNDNAKTTSETLFPLQKSNYECKNNYCNMTGSNDFLEYPFTFQMRADGLGEYRVENITRSFPVWKFLHKISDSKHLIGINSSSLTNELCKMHSSSTCCSCDLKVCMKFNTCCMDVLWDENQSISIDEYINNFIDASKHYKKQTCEKLIPGTPTMYISYKMVSTCSNSLTKIRSEKCTSVGSTLRSYLPVIGQDGYLYRNAYCAECNDVVTYHAVDLAVECLNHALATSFQSCQFSIETDNSTVIKKCLNDEDINYELYNDFCMTNGHYVFRNIHCDKCRFQIDFDENAIITFWYSWSLMISFTINGKIDSIQPLWNCKVHMCDENDFSSIMTLPAKTALPANLTCGNRDEALRGFDEIDNCLEEGINLHLFIVTSNMYNFDIKIVTMGKILEILNTTQDRISIYFQNSSVIVRQFNKTIRIDEINGIISYMYEILSLTLTHEVRFVFTPSKEPLISNFTSIIHTFPNRKYCHSLETEQINMKKISSLCDSVKESTKRDEYIFVNFDQNGLTTNLARCKLFFSELDVPHASALNDAIIYIAVIVLPLSLFSYAVLLILVTRSSYIESYHKKMIIVLFSCILFADGLFMISYILTVSGYNKIFVVCKVTGILMHFGVVMSLQWLMILGYILYTRCVYRRQVVDITKHLLLTASISILIIVGSLIFDYTKIIQIGYGENGICALQGFQGRLFFHIIPLAACVIGTLVLITKSIYTLLNEYNIDKENLNISLILIGITIVIGLTEGVGFVQSNNISVPSLILSLSYVLLRSVRGFMLTMLCIYKRNYNPSIGDKKKAVHSKENHGSSNDLELNDFYHSGVRR